MAFNYTVEDSSPLITYSENAWTDAGNDTLLNSYSGSSYHFTKINGASASFQFNGTGVWVFGAKRPNYGEYTITVDGENVVTAGAGSTQDQVKQVLGAKTNMTYGAHRVVFSSSSTSQVDIDFIEVETRLSGDKVTIATIDDDDPRITYQPSSDWRVNNRDIFVKNTLHFSQTKGASASLSFSGEAVAVYGTSSPDHADLQIVVDGQTLSLPGGSGGRTAGLHTQVLLFYKDGLGQGQHSLSITSDQRSGTGPFIDLDAVFVYSSNSATGNSSQGDAAPSSTRPSESSAVRSSSIPTGTIIGAAVGGTIGLILLLVLLHFLYRRRRINLEEKDSPGSPVTPVLPLQQPRISEIPTKTETEGRFNVPRPFFSHSRAPSGASSSNSSVPMLRDAPILNAPKPSHMHARSISSGSTPTRPTQRPPTLNLPG